jgi:hypothetical protein
MRQGNFDFQRIPTPGAARRSPAPADAMKGKQRPTTQV